MTIKEIFEKRPYLNVSEVGRMAGIEPGNMRSYATGRKIPGAAVEQKIMEALHKIAQEMQDL